MLSSREIRRKLNHSVIDVRPKSFLTEFWQLRLVRDPRARALNSGERICFATESRVIDRQLYFRAYSIHLGSLPRKVWRYATHGCVKKSPRNRADPSIGHASECEILEFQDVTGCAN